jgi:peroxiredoxin
VVSVSIDKGPHQAVTKLVKDYVKSNQLTFLNLLDPNASVASQYGVSGLPVSFFIDPRGKAIAFAIGYRKWGSKDGQKMIEQLLSETQ